MNFHALRPFVLGCVLFWLAVFAIWQAA